MLTDNRNVPFLDHRCVNPSVQTILVLLLVFGLMLVQSSVTRRRCGCGNVGIPRLLRDFPVRGGAVEKSG